MGHNWKNNKKGVIHLWLMTTVTKQINMHLSSLQKCTVTGADYKWHEHNHAAQYWNLQATTDSYVQRH